MKYALYLTLPLFALGSCGGGETETEVTETEFEQAADREVAPTAGTMPGAEGVSINETVDAVRGAGGDITAIPAGAATGVIDGWIAKLSGTPGASTVVGGLKELKTELTAGNIDGARVGSLLSKLAADTRAMAPDNIALGNLADALQAGGNKLTNM